jgi:hypothetical protein
MGSGPNSPRHIPSNVTATPSRHVLPNDLPAAVKHLEDQELDLLFDAVVAERLRRGMKSPVPEKTPSQRTVDAAAVSLNLGKVNAVRAAFKAGVTPSKNGQRVWNFSSGCSEGNCQRRVEASAVTARSLIWRSIDPSSGAPIDELARRVSHKREPISVLCSASTGAGGRSENFAF